MKRHTLHFALAVLALLPSCGPKRKPAVLEDPGRRPAERGTATATPEPTTPVDAGPDIQAAPDGGPKSIDDYTVNDETGENGPLEDVHFAYDQANLSDEARAILEKHGVWLQSHRTAKVTVEGHCDERGTVDYNLALGDKRARAVSEYLVSLGVASDRLHTVSLGKERPLDTSGTEAAFAKNRRAHFVVSR
jgi:peptidoglycan-associated lipoprotein